MTVRLVNLKTLKILLWCILYIFIIFIDTLHQIRNEEDNLKEVTTQIEEWKNKYKTLLDIFEAACTENKNLSLQNNSQAQLTINRLPPLLYEELRRKVYTNTKELWYFLNNAINESFSRENRMTEFIKKGKSILEIVAHRKMSLLADMEKVEEEDGWHEWRKRKATEVGELVQKRLSYLYLQDRSYESTTRTCFANMVRMCGYGCQIHRTAFCLVYAYAISKPVQVAILKPVVNYSVLSILQPVAALNNQYMGITHLEENIFDEECRPLSVPKDLAISVIRFNGDPASWWIGQLVKFVFKPLSHVQVVINNTITKLNVSSPIVGIHVRRTDKTTEAASHSIEEYMYHVKDYYDKLEMKNLVTIVVRKVYIATDDIDIIDEACTKFPKYNFLYDKDIVKTADTRSRWNQEGMIGLLVDVSLLAMCDFFVGTFSSQVSKLVYEIMQANRYDASNSFFSLDDIYFFPVMQRPHNRKALISHQGNDTTISFKVGDLIGVAGNHWDGYGKGINRRTNESGLFPWYKTSDHLVMYPFPKIMNTACP